MWQREQFTRHGIVETVNAGHAVSHRNDGAHFRHRHAAIEIFDLLADDFGDFVSFDLWHCFGPSCQRSAISYQLLHELTADGWVLTGSFSKLSAISHHLSTSAMS
jgi:hypothetical protein